MQNEMGEPGILAVYTREWAAEGWREDLRAALLRTVADSLKIWKKAWSELSQAPLGIDSHNGY